MLHRSRCAHQPCAPRTSRVARVLCTARYALLASRSLTETNPSNVQDWTSRSAAQALIARQQTFAFDLTLTAKHRSNPREDELRLLTFEGTERLLGARVKDLHDKGLQLVQVLSWFRRCFEQGPLDFAKFSQEQVPVCVRNLPLPLLLRIHDYSFCVFMITVSHRYNRALVCATVWERLQWQLPPLLLTLLISSLFRH
jgi:hypothetical protein